MAEDRSHQRLSRRALVKLGAAGGLAAALPSTFLCPEALAQGRKVLSTIITPEPPIVVPGINNQGPTLIVGGKLFEGLLSYSPRLGARPALAKSWEISSDDLTYTFNLQTGVTWHDGKPFSADDVVFNLTKLHPEVNPRLRATLANIESAVAKDPATVVIKLKTPFEPFILNFDATTLPMLPKHLYEGTDLRNNPANQNPVGTGPFRYGEWQRGNFIRLVKFDKYWQPGKPSLDEIVYRIIPDSNLRGVALQSGQVQMAAFNDIEAFDVPRFRGLPNLEVAINGWELFAPLSWIDINNRVKPLDDPKVRRAMSMAIDRNFILNRLWFGVGKAATSPICSTTKFHDATVKVPAFNVAEANKLLDEAGHPRKADGTRFELRFMTLPYGEIWNRLGEYIRQAFGQIGVKLNAEAVDAATWARRVGEWDYDLTVNFVYQWGDPTIGVERTYVSSNIQKITFTNTMGYSNPKVDAAFLKARQSAKAEDRQAAFSEVQKILVEDMPVIWLLELAFPTITDKRLKNVITSATGIHDNFAGVTLG
ncbi:MAG: ABC transporter substrate-binding protein [Rhizobiales bacterium]|nr:ABC transporter substrate-binding protein [Hyphomicrobiales bacterium]